MRCLVILFLCINLFPESSFTQSTQPYGSLNNTQSVRDELGIAMKNGVQNAYTVPRRYEGVQGNPFYNSQWTTGIVCLVKDSAVVNNGTTRYKFESFTNELWILNGKDSMIAYSKDIYWFVLDEGKVSHTFLKFPKYSNGNPNKFFRNLYNGNKIRFVQEAKKDLRRADFIDKGMYSSGLPYDRFEEKNVYLLSVGNDILRKVKLSVSDLTDMLDGAIQKKMKQYARQNKLKGKLSEQEAINFIQYADGL
ncbi:MAG: hypothetical protein LW630_09205 [Saprospiraceae bacterium]|jgi:hypothetical protein|nr:hypothetical protein [Saprospiraceae bacterium]